MKALVVGCGRVGAALAKAMRDEGWQVTAVDENEEALGRLGEDWAGGFVVGHGMDTGVLEEAGIQDVHAIVVATNGDNTNIVVAQVALLGYKVPNVAVRILDPARAAFYSGRGMTVVSPTKSAIESLEGWIRTAKGAA